MKSFLVACMLFVALIAPAFAGLVEDDIRSDSNVAVAQSVTGECLDFQIHHEILKKSKWIAKENSATNRTLTCHLSLFEEYTNGRRTYTFFADNYMVTFAGRFDASRNALNVDRVYNNDADHPLEAGIDGLCALVQGNGAKVAKDQFGIECYASLTTQTDRVVFEVIQKIQSVNKIKDHDTTGENQ